MSSQADGVNICQLIDNLDRHREVLLLLGALFTIRQCSKYVNQEIYSGSCRQNKLHRERLRELEAQWSAKK